jgi:hypothetical protein
MLCDTTILQDPAFSLQSTLDVCESSINPLKHIVVPRGDIHSSDPNHEAKSEHVLSSSQTNIESTSDNLERSSQRRKPGLRPNMTVDASISIGAWHSVDPEESTLKPDTITATPKTSFPVLDDSMPLDDSNFLDENENSKFGENAGNPASELASSHVLQRKPKKSITIRNWSIHPATSSKADGFQVVVEGVMENGKVWHSSVIHERESARKLRSINGSLYVVQGELNPVRTVEAG